MSPNEFCVECGFEFWAFLVQHLGFCNTSTCELNQEKRPHGASELGHDTRKGTKSEGGIVWGFFHIVCTYGFRECLAIDEAPPRVTMPVSLTSRACLEDSCFWVIIPKCPLSQHLAV